MKKIVATLLILAIILSIPVAIARFTGGKRVQGWQIVDGCIESGHITDDTIQDSDFNHTDVRFLNYSDAGTYTTDKILVANGSSFTGHQSITEGGLTTVDYIVASCTSNASLLTAVNVTGTNTFDVYLYYKGTANEPTTAECVNWTAIGD